MGLKLDHTSKIHVLKSQSSCVLFFCSANCHFCYYTEALAWWMLALHEESKEKSYPKGT